MRESIMSTRPGRDLVELELSGHRYALPMEQVIELALCVRSRPLPGAPFVVEGMVNHGGTAIPLVSLRRVLGLPVRETWNDHLIVVQTPTRIVALRVDRAVGLLTVDDAAVTSAAPSRQVRGVVVLADNDLLYIQDVDALLSLSEDAELSSAIAAATEADGNARAPA
jgi:chemotaxis signal transduction protein